MLTEIISALAGLTFFLAAVPYIRAVLKGQAQPVMATWFIWASLDIIILWGMFVTNAVNWQSVGAAAGGSAVALLTIKYGRPGWTRVDKFCLTGAILSVALWLWFDNPTLGILTSSTALFLGSIPTFISAYEDPSREDKLAWTMCFVAAIPMVILVPVWDFNHATQPILLFVIETVMTWLVWRKLPEFAPAVQA